MLTPQQRRWVRRLHRVMPEYRFRVLSADRARVARHAGEAWETCGVASRPATRGGMGTIMLADDLPELSWKDGLLHEAGHIVADANHPRASDKSPHGAAWGCAFALCYRRFYGQK